MMLKYQSRRGVSGWMRCAVIACLALVAIAGTAQAQTPTVYGFSAIVTQADPGSGVATGTVFTGTLSWDPLAAVIDPDPFSNGNATEYEPGVITITGLGSLDGIYGGAGNIRVVDDNFNAGSPTDQFLMEIFGAPNSVDLELTDIGGGLWSTQSLADVTTLLAPVGQFEIATLRIGDGFEPAGIMTAAISHLSVWAEGPANAQSLFTEDFTTTAFRNGPATDATWDTAGGELRHELGFGMDPIGTLPGGSQFRDVAVTGNVAVAAVSGAGVVLADISDPTNPVQIGFFGTYAFKLAVAGDLAIIAGSNSSGVQILDISDPTNPTLLSAYQPVGLDARDVAVVGTKVYVADYNSGLLVLDISDPTAPFPTLSYPSAGYFTVEVVGSLAYLGSATKAPGLTILDVSDDMVAVPVASYVTPACYEVLVSDGLAYFAAGAGGLQILDVSVPASPVPLGTYGTSGETYGLARAGTRLFLAEYGAGLSVLDATDPTSPVLEFGPIVPALSVDVALFGESVYLANNGNLQIYATSGSHGVSLPVDGGNHVIPRARLTAAGSPGVVWEVSATNGADFTPMTPGSAWTRLDVAGDDLVWRATLSPSLDPTAFPNPSVIGLTLEWLLEAPSITSIADIPDDQGRQVRLQWERSGFDFVGDPSQIVEYAVYRRFEAGLAAEKGAAAAWTGQGLGPAAAQHAQAMAAAGWDFVTTVPVRAQDGYAVVVPTLADSSIAGGLAFSTFMVSALTATPGVFYDSAPASGYSVDNLAPGAPQGVVATYAAAGVSLDWADAPETDFRAFRVYRGTDPGFVPGPANLVQETGTSAWVDPVSDPWSFRYKVTAVDFAGNESDVGAPGEVSGVADDVARARNVLRDATPNPFNPSTRLAFELAAPGRARLRVYDPAGRLVATLLDEHREAGPHHVTWDGRDDRGRPAAAGVYLYRIEAGPFHDTRRMTLVK